VLKEHDDNHHNLINLLDTLEVLSTLLVRLEYFYE
jgi:hypothetical protein